jgi:hypothetical protein
MADLSVTIVQRMAAVSVMPVKEPCILTMCIMVTVILITVVTVFMRTISFALLVMSLLAGKANTMKCIPQGIISATIAMSKPKDLSAMPVATISIQKKWHTVAQTCARIAVI